MPRQETRRNLARNPRAASVTQWVPSNAAVSSHAALTGQAAPFVGGPTTAVRLTFSAASGPVAGLYTGGAAASALIPATPGAAYAGSGWVRPSRAQRMAARAYYYDAGGVSLGVTVGAVVPAPAGVWTRLEVASTAPAGAVRATLALYADASGASWVIGDTLDVTAALFGPGSTVGTYFDGSSPDAGPFEYNWTGAVDDSASTEQRIPLPTLSPTVDQPRRSVALVVGSQVGYPIDAVDVRRITPGYPPTPVRNATELDTSGGTVVIYDHEPPLGLTSQYQARGYYSDGDTSDWSEPVAAAVDCEFNEVWVKDLAQPLNSHRFVLRDLGGRQREPRLELHYVKGDPFPVAVSDVRLAPREQIVLGCKTETDSAMLETLLGSGHVLLFQVPPTWGRRDGFFAVGNAEELRVRQFGPQPERDWRLELTQSRPPATVSIGGTATVTYQAIKDTYTSYGALLDARGTYLGIVTDGAEA